MQRALLILMSILAVTVAVAQDSGDVHFIKITHEPGQTIAIDSSGQKWIYDAEKSEFVSEDDYEGSAGRSGDRTEPDYGPDDVVLPPEIRCTDIRKGDITDLFGEVVVELDQRIQGSITCGRDVTVKGLVTGNVLSYRTVTIESTGEVRGDVVARRIVRERGGRILGQRTEVPFPENIAMPKVSGSMPPIAGIILTAFFAFICVITIALFPRQLDRIVNVIKGGEVKSFFFGLLAWFSIVPVFVLLLITIVGIPIAILVFPFALIAAFLLAYVAASIYIGERVCPLCGWQDKSIYVKSIAGVVFIAMAPLMASLFYSIGAEALGGLLSFVFGLVAFTAITCGLGAVVSSRFGTRPKTAGMAPDTEPPQEPHPAPPVKPPPPPRTEPLPPQVVAPPPPVPPPVPKSDNATDEG